MFSKFLPAEAAEQKQEQEEWEKQPYDEEDASGDEYGDEMLGTAPIPEPDPNTELQEGQPENADENQDSEQKKAGEEAEEEYYDSDYDENGKYIWGKEGEDWEFYDQEDKDAYEQGLSTMPEPLNKESLPTELNTVADEKTGVALTRIKALKQSEAVYMTHKKKTKPQTKQWRTTNPTVNK